MLWMPSWELPAIRMTASLMVLGVISALVVGSTDSAETGTPSGCAGAGDAEGEGRLFCAAEPESAGEDAASGEETVWLMFGYRVDQYPRSTRSLSTATAQTIDRYVIVFWRRHVWNWRGGIALFGIHPTATQ